jgi:alpha-1,4-digalacturonate transport system permease protein
MADGILQQTRNKSTIWKVLVYLIVITFTLYTLFPFYWMIITAFKPSPELTTIPPKFFPSKFMWGNLKYALTLAPFGTYLKNSAIVATLSVVITVFINLLAGFAFAKYKFKGKNFLFLIVLSTLMIPEQIMMVPNFLILSMLGWLNSYVGLIVPQCAEAFGLFLARQFISEIPDELIEAGIIDGASGFKVFLKIIVPNIKPLAAVLIIFTFMWRWNDFLWPLVVTSDQQFYTVQVGLALIQGSRFTDWNSLMSASLIIILPVILVFLVFQKYFVQGVATTGLK